ncbi:hypothetical protein FUAX_27780 [Fulvitalea axinellae]|uniref:Uncharacterized protein n=1 Tax=Fulvitalea axinellae TaxID=1182444 RepID=A0AAU9DB90_9BACT|nr:hypothetical protein FUAX_27780 [Fulvitalea axinellae]
MMKNNKRDSHSLSKQPALESRLFLFYPKLLRKENPWFNPKPDPYLKFKPKNKGMARLFQNKNTECS